jgi:hypothetical protein
MRKFVLLLVLGSACVAQNGTTTHQQGPNDYLDIPKNCETMTTSDGSTLMTCECPECGNDGQQDHAQPWNCALVPAPDKRAPAASFCSPDVPRVPSSPKTDAPADQLKNEPRTEPNEGGPNEIVGDPARWTI